MPRRGTFYSWLARYPGLRPLYHAALEQRADAKVEEIDALEAELRTETDLGRIRAIETAIKSKQWQASRLGRARWGVHGVVKVEVPMDHPEASVESLNEALERFKRSQEAKAEANRRLGLPPGETFE